MRIRLTEYIKYIADEEALMQASIFHTATSKRKRGRPKLVCIDKINVNWRLVYYERMFLKEIVGRAIWILRHTCGLYS